jgi:hypothetical protein
MPTIERRTQELIDIVPSRQKMQNGVINFSDAVNHWSFDTMVRRPLLFWSWQPYILLPGRAHFRRCLQNCEDSILGYHLPRLNPSFSFSELDRRWRSRTAMGPRKFRNGGLGNVCLIQTWLCYWLRFSTV